MVVRADFALTGGRTRADMGAAARLFKTRARTDRLEWRPVNCPSGSGTGRWPPPCPLHLIQHYSDHKAPFLAGVKACLAVLPGVASFGMICGAAMVAAGLSKTAATAMTLLTFAGTMQLAAVQLAATGAPLVIIALAGIIINLRFVMFSLSISRHFRGLPARVRALNASR